MYMICSCRKNGRARGGGGGGGIDPAAGPQPHLREGWAEQPQKSGEMLEAHPQSDDSSARSSSWSWCPHAGPCWMALAALWQALYGGALGLVKWPQLQVLPACLESVPTPLHQAAAHKARSAPIYSNLTLRFLGLHLMFVGKLMALHLLSVREP